MRVHFKVVCDKCNQPLHTDDGQSFRHENPADCDAGGATLPECSVEQLTELLQPKPVVKSSPETAHKKAAKKGKK